MFLVSGYRMIHGFTCTGLTETQYVNYCKASKIGHVEEKYISTGKEHHTMIPLVISKKQTNNQTQN